MLRGREPEDLEAIERGFVGQDADQAEGCEEGARREEERREAVDIAANPCWDVFLELARDESMDLINEGKCVVGVFQDFICGVAKGVHVSDLRDDASFGRWRWLSCCGFHDARSSISEVLDDVLVGEWRWCGIGSAGDHWDVFC